MTIHHGKTGVTVASEGAVQVLAIVLAPDDWALVNVSAIMAVGLQEIAVVATTLVRAHCVRAGVCASIGVRRALVHVDASDALTGPLRARAIRGAEHSRGHGEVQLVADAAGAYVTSRKIMAFLQAAAIVQAALFDVLARRTILAKVKADVARAFERVALLRTQLRAHIHFAIACDVRAVIM